MTATNAASSATWPNQHESDYIIEEFRFDSGEVLPELRLHYTNGLDG